MSLEKIIVSGFGGQGVVLLSHFIGVTAMKEGKNYTCVPSYGPEMRGGTCHCQIVYSDEIVASPVVSKADVVIAFNNASIDKFVDLETKSLKKLKEGGILMYNSSLIEESQLPDREDIKVYAIPATELDSNAPNMVMLGAYIKIMKKLKLKTVEKEVLPEELTGGKAKFIKSNIEAIKKGIKYVKKNY